MEISKYRDRLLTDTVFLPGSRDAWGGPLLVVVPPHTITSTTPSVEEGTQLPLGYNQLVSIIGYLSTIPNESAVEKGFTVIVDGRRVSPKIVITVLKGVQQGLYKKVRQAVIIQPEKFLDQQKLNLDLLLEAFSFKVPCVSIHKLTKFVSIGALPEIFGGVYGYEAKEWISTRERVEKMNRDLESVLSGLKIEKATKLNETHEKILKSGEELANELATSSSSEDDLHSAVLLRRLVAQCNDVLSEPQRRTKVKEEIEATRLADCQTTQMNDLLDWLEGVGETWLLSLREIGESRDEARQLVKQHAQLKTKVQELESQTEQLSEMGNKLVEILPTHAATLDKSRAHLKQVVAQFSSRVQRGKEMAEKSERFHEKMNLFTRRADSLLDSLCSESSSESSAVISQRTKMEEEVEQLKCAYDELKATGGEFIEDLASNEISPFGKKMCRDYTAGVVHIREQLESANERRRRCLDLVDVRLLRLQHLIQLSTCERDADQSIEWLREMKNTLDTQYLQIEFSQDEVDHLREDHTKLEAAARSTYDYGKDLCQVALVLRRSLRMEQKKGVNTEDKLEQMCTQLCRSLSEKEARLAMTEAYLGTMQSVEEQLETVEKKAKTMGDRPAKHVYLSSDRRRIASQLADLKHLGEAICGHINSQTSLPSEIRSGKMRTISEKVDNLSRKYQEVERLFVEKNPISSPLNLDLHPIQE
ncbi:hypothetical protein PMAYCL1PPCAC_23575 [Pristionchus mayeri]|uniref:SESTD1-like spectrin repeats region domain-containing protein n=1 Tax=Pristionchus mayeri TaxID=1317129 RepID=A0AAN5D038_9BILA|nr:hypothetical protein PMAYCL1PPCAC_23575 [Pristionchus mayeri]